MVLERSKERKACFLKSLENGSLKLPQGFMMPINFTLVCMMILRILRISL